MTANERKDIDACRDRLQGLRVMINSICPLESGFEGLNPACKINGLTAGTFQILMERVDLAIAALPSSKKRA